MVLLNYLSDVITQSDYAVIEGEKRKAILRIVHGRAGYHVLVIAGTVKLYTPAFPNDVAAKKHAKACQPDLWKLAQARSAGLEDLAEAVLLRA